MSLESGDIRLNSDFVYKFGNVLLEDNSLNIIDIAIDECDILYLADQRRNLIFTYDPHNAVLKPVGCYPGVLPLKLNTLSAIGVDRDTLYIGDFISINGAVSARMMALAKRDLQIRWVLLKDSDGKPLNRILDIECDNKGNIHLLESESGRILYIGRESSDHPAAHSVYSPEPGSSEPKDLAVDIEGSLYVLYESKLHIHYTTSGEKEIPVRPGNLLVPSGLAVNSLGEIFIGEQEADDGSDSEISQKTIHKLSGETFIPLWSYRGASRRLISDQKGNLYVVNDKGNKVASLSRQKVNLPDKEGAFKGFYISEPIDSQTLNTRWHRLLLEGEFEKGTQTEFWYYVSDKLLSDNEIKEMAPDQWYRCISENSSIQGDKKRDALFLEDVQGRYLWFRIILSGNEVRSPVVRAITLFFPRISYIDYLPAIYREDPLGRGLLERFLAIFESIFFDIDVTIEHIERYFDAFGAPSEFLSWLGCWLALTMDEDWPDDKKRLFISKAISLYKKRGTREGMEESIELLTGEKPFIVEIFRGRKPCKKVIPDICNKEDDQEDTIFFPSEEDMVKWPVKDNDKEAIKEMPLIDILYGNERFGFCVILRDPGVDAVSLRRIRKLIEEQKPAHTCYGLKVLQPQFYLDMHTYLGVNTMLTKPEFSLEVTSVIGRDTILHDEEQAGQAGRHARIGIDSRLS